MKGEFYSEALHPEVKNKSMGRPASATTGTLFQAVHHGEARIRGAWPAWHGLVSF
jgi:hypothetical protein